MANKLELILSLSDKMSKGLTKANDAVRKFSNEMKSVGGDINAVGSTMAQFGAGVTGPFVLALNNASKSTSAVRNEITKLSSVSNSFQRDIAVGVLPVVQDFTNGLNALYQRFQQIPEVTRNAALQAVLLGGAYLTLSGVLITMIGKIQQAVGALVTIGSALAGIALAHPILAAVAVSIGVLLVLMYKFEGVSNVVLTAFEGMALGIKIQLTNVIVNLQAVQLKALEVVITIIDGFSKLPSILGVALSQATEGLRLLGEGINIVRNEQINAMTDDMVRLSEIMKGEPGEWAGGFKNVKESIEETITTLTGLFEGVDTTGVRMRDTFEKIKLSTKQIADGFTNAVGQMVVIGTDFGTTMAGVFKQWASKAIAEITRVLAKMALMKAASKSTGIFGSVFGFLGGLFHDGGAVQKAHTGGIIKAHEGLAVDEVPIIAQTGEGILSRRGMQALGGTGALNALNSGQGIGGATSINIYIASAAMDSQQTISDTAETLGFEIERALRRSRGI